MKKKLEDVVLPALLIALALGGAAVIAHTAVVLALGLGAPDQPFRFISGAGLIALAACLWVCYALSGGEPAFGWARRSCQRIQAWQAREQQALRNDIIAHLASLSPEEREKEVERLTDGSSVISMDIPDKESFLHPRNWPYDRIKPGCFD